MAITQATLREAERLRRQLQSLTDAQTRALTAAWVDAWDVLLPEFEAALTELLAAAADGTVTRAVVARNVRLQGALRAVRTYMDVLAPQAATTISNDLTTAVLEAAEGHEAIVRSQLPPGAPGAAVSFTRVPEEALAAIVQRTTQRIHKATQPLPADVERMMKKELVRGIAVGANPRKTAARIVKQAEGQFNGGLTRALVISRTETLDAHRAATKASERANADILTEWEWSAHLDRRTCPSCIAKHGQRFPLEESGPLDHHQGRCARISVTKTWKELGFNIEEPPSETKDGRAWFDSLTQDTQEGIMGKERLRLLQAGEISWDDLSTKRSTPGWRDSYHVTPLKDLTK